MFQHAGWLGVGKARSCEPSTARDRVPALETTSRHHLNRTGPIM